ncbi:MAG: orotate phosphoribosyltransferase [Synergistaceae bacterium]|nr:orotate phosphoribosyltransferase [Synergistaceae bacterium]
MNCKCEGGVSEKILEMMRESGAHLHGHFKLTSGLHSDNYMQCALMLRYPAFAAYAGEELAKLLAPAKPDFILSPALGGLIIGHEVARALGLPFIFTERADGDMRLKRFPHPGKLRFALVEDVCTTGKSSREAARILVDGGAEWVASGCVVDRRSPDCQPDWDLKSLVKVHFATYTAEECPMCAAGEPLVKPGSRPDKK